MPWELVKREKSHARCEHMYVRMDVHACTHGTLSSLASTTKATRKGYAPWPIIKKDNMSSLGYAKKAGGRKEQVQDAS